MTAGTASPGQGVQAAAMSPGTASAVPSTNQTGAVTGNLVGGQTAAPGAGGTPGALGTATSDTAIAASVVPAYIQPITLPLPPIIFPFSPNSFTLSAEARIRNTTQAGTASGEGSPQSAGVNPTKMSVEIQLDQFSVPPVPVMLTAMELQALLPPDPIMLAAGSATAPRVVFGWGPNIILSNAIVTKVSIKYERFLMGMPVRALATVELQRVPSPFPLTNPTSGGLATRRTYTTVEGDNLALVAHREYKDPSKWRAIAIANNIDDPMRVKPGTELIIPDKREADVLAA